MTSCQRPPSSPACFLCAENPQYGGWSVLMGVPCSSPSLPASLVRPLFSKLLPSSQPPQPAQGRGPTSLTGVGTAPAEIQAPQRTAVVGVQGCRPGEVELVQGHGTVEYVLQEGGPQLLTYECYGLHSLCRFLPLPFSKEGSFPSSMFSWILMR